MRPSPVSASARRLGLRNTDSSERPDELALVVGRRRCWTKPRLLHALDQRSAARAAREELTAG